MRAHDIESRITYLADRAGPAVHRVYPQASGRETERPPVEQCAMPITDGRRGDETLALETHGFELLDASSAVELSFETTQDARIVRDYYPECEALVKAATGAQRVKAFDHNIRCRARAEAGEPGMREPVLFAHNDYTHESGPVRAHAILADDPEADRWLKGRFAFINLWRPLRGPVRDKPLAVCDARSLDAGDLVPTEIQHYHQPDLEHPAHVGHIYSVRRNPGHRWFYFSEMLTSEALLLKCYDSRVDAPARFMPHTAIDLPESEQEPPRESIEVRTLVLFDD